jgi:hypothetical protein
LLNNNVEDKNIEIENLIKDKNNLSINLNKAEEN